MTHQDKQAKFVTALSRIYGNPILNDGDYIYHFNVAQRQIAKDLRIDATKLNKLLNTQKAKEYTNHFAKYTQLAERYWKAEEYDKLYVKKEDLSKKYRLSSLLTLGLLGVAVMLGILLVLSNQSKNRYKKIINTEKDNIEISIKQAVTLLELLGGESVAQLSLEAAIANEKFKGFGKGITATDSIEIMRQARNRIQKVVSHVRGKSKNIKFLTVEGKSIFELVSEVSPEVEMFRCKDSMLTFSSRIPECAGRYDTALYETRRIIFDRDISIAEIKDLIEPKIVALQGMQNRAILERNSN